MEQFDNLKKHLSKELDKRSFDNWISPLSYVGFTNDILFVGSPDKQKTDWLNANLLNKVNPHLKTSFGYTLKIVPLYDEQLTVISDEYEDESASNNKFFTSNLNKKYTFESFVQQESNQLAYSFSYNVSLYPGTSYNPLYIYSDVGLGKTHLLHAIGNKILQNNQRLKIKYLTSDEFMSEYTNYSLQKKRESFVKDFSQLDVLLIDDIQFITKWEGTNERFYYLLNKLIDMEKQIVICSDTHPENIRGLENRIKSRFEMGSIIDILPYDFEGRLAILEKKMEERKKAIKYDFHIPKDTLEFIAQNFTENIRAVEGALNRLLGVANLRFSNKTDSLIDIEFAKDALKPLLKVKKKKITFKTIQEFIANKYNIKVADLISKSNKKDIAFPRQIAMYLCKSLTTYTLDEIGKNFGGKHHSTVLHSIKKVENSVENDPDFSKIVNNYLEYFK